MNSPSILKTALVALALVATCASASAQLFEKKVLSLAAARKIASAAEAEAKKANATVVIAIVDDGGNLILLERLDDTQVASVQVAMGKARTAAIFRRPSREFEELIGRGRTAMVALEGFTPLQGGVPILHEGKCIGAIGVSGNSPQQDEEIAYAGAAVLAPTNGTAAEASSEVTHLDGARVASAFQKGEVLLDGGSYMIHASRRDKAGEAEVHELESDLIYVLDGTATFVTGGSVEDGMATAPGEIRGRAIRGGESRRLAKGDVVVVPKGTPHWFQAVPGPFTYYVVKVR